MSTMNRTDAFDLQEFDVRYLVTGLWQSMLGLDIQRGAASIPADTLLGAAIDIRGAFAGRVELCCDAELARLAAAQLMSIDVTACTQEDAQDTICELANVAGGNIKALVDGLCNLSFPQRIDPTAERYGDHEVQIGTWSFTCLGRCVTLRVIAHPDRVVDQSARS